MAKPTIPDRLIELAERWCSPLRWQMLLRESGDMHRDREHAREAAAAGRKYPEIEPVTAGIIDHYQSFAAAAERRYNALWQELVEIQDLTRRHAPRLIGYASFRAGPFDVEEQARDMKALWVALLGESPAVEWMGPLNATEWGAVWRVHRNTATPRLRELEKQGLAQRKGAQQWEVSRSVLSAQEQEKVARKLH